MLLTISTTHQPTSALGYLCHKHPDKFQTFDFPYGKIHVFYPEVSSEKCTIALLLDINPIELLRSKKNTKDFVLKQYVNDRPYVASSLMSAALSKVLSSAMNGNCEAFPELVEVAMPLEVHIAILPARGDEDLLSKIFHPLGYQVELQRHILDPKFPEWGQSDYYTVTLRHHLPLHQLLKHLYVLIPVLDDEKHYWVGEAEIEKLLLKGETWLKDHPEKDLITHRYLRHQRSLSSQALERLIGDEVSEEADPLLDTERLEQIVMELRACQAKTVVDLGCGTGKLLELLLREKQFEKIIGADISHYALEAAKKRLYMEDMAPRQRERIELLHSSLTYNDKRLYGFDAIVIIDAVKYLDSLRLNTFERIIFAFAQPKSVIITNPNRNVSKEKDHWVWKPEEFQAWCENTASKHGYAVRFKNLVQQTEHNLEEQMGVFTLKWR